MAKKSTRSTPPQTSKPATTNNSLPTSVWLPWALAGLAFILFSFGFSNKMAPIDDHSATVNNPAVLHFSLFGQFNLGMYAPLTWLGYAISYQLGGAHPLWYHLLSAGVHAVNVALVFKLFQRLQTSQTVSAVVALCFAIHPMQVESVTWIAAISTPLYALFSLLALNFYLKNLRDAAGGFAKDYWLALAMFLLACLSKSAAVVLPLSLMVLDAWMRRPLNRQVLIEKIPFFLVALPFGALTLYGRALAGHTADAAAPIVYSLADRGLMVCHTVLFYWTKLLSPFPALSIWYPFEKTAAGAWHWTYYAAPFALSGLLYLAWRVRHQMPFVWYGVLFYLVNVVLALPYATFGTFELRSDRYNYLACLGVFAVLAMLPGFFSEKKSAWESRIWGILCLLLLGWAASTLLRIRDWRDGLTLMTRAIETSGDNFGRAYLWRGMEYGDNGKVKESVEDLSKAIQINPALTEAYKYRGGLYGMMKQYQQSVADLNIYLQRNPNDAEQLYNRGLSLLNTNKLPEAVADFTRTLEINPDFVRAYRARGNVYKTLGETAKSEADLAEWERRKDSMR